MTSLPKFYQYFQRVTKTESWAMVPADESLDYVLKHQPFMASVLQTTYNPDQADTHDNPLYRGPMYFDFDDKDDPAAAVQGGLKLISRLEGLGVDPECLELYLSGGKGVHVLVPSKVFMDSAEMDKGIAGLPQTYLRMVWDAFVIDGIDFNVVCQPECQHQFFSTWFQKSRFIATSGNYAKVFPIFHYFLHNVLDEVHLGFHFRDANSETG